jgi:hypothetical protein
MLRKRRRFLLILLIIVLPVFFISYFIYRAKAAPVKANISIDMSQPVGVINFNWKALAQGGEEPGTRMLQPVVSQLSDLGDYYIRLDHIYDFYKVVDRDGEGHLTFNWTDLDATVCDIYATGAKPFLSLGYMPPVISSDGSLIATPTSWSEWSLVVQKTVEHYSGRSSVLCNGTVAGDKLGDVYYEVWNEPDLELFGKWSIYGGNKDYKTLYYYSVLGASRAQNVYNYNIGGPVITAPYKNWFQTFLRYVKKNNLRIDFISWHKYTKNPEDYGKDLDNINSWLADPEFDQYRNLPRIISEWGFDSDVNAAEDSQMGAAHTVASVKQMIDRNLHLAFAFEAKDGPNPSWGILRHNGTPKPRYYALKFLNSLDRTKLNIQGEGTYVQGIATVSKKKYTIILSNYDISNRNVELVPVNLYNIVPGTYNLTISNLYGVTGKDTLQITDGTLNRSILMNPNMVVSIILEKVGE